ncbi:adenosylcobinamide-GDP ribazoletransferase, partial [Micromonospora peucetia]
PPARPRPGRVPRPVAPSRAGSRPGMAAGAVAVALPALAAVPGRPWQGPLAVAAALAVAVWLLRHVVRRLGGVTGDVLGATVELVTTLVYLGLVLSG